MKLILDEGLPRSLAQLLCDVGILTVHVAEIGLLGCADSEIIDYAKIERAVVVTLDSDFQTAIALSGDTSPSVIRIRDDKLKAPQLSSLLLRITDIHGVTLDAGAFMSVTEARIAIKELPILKDPPIQ